ncbi:MAG TPA: hypothetical protein VHB79_12905 [Polyangiaceae bacterium]|nr:hypothetical protein [Polyangiaceae bacterium]
MPSSTSSSELVVDRPARSFLGAVCVGLILGVAALAAYEVFWRRVGLRSELQDTAELWATKRMAADDAGPAALAIVGSSRFQVGIDPEALAAELPGAVPLQLAISGSPGLPILRDLAEDPHFLGTVLCEVTPTSTFTPLRITMKGRPVEWADYARTRPAVAAWEGQLRGFAQSHLVILSSGLNTVELIERLAKKRGFPTPPYATFRSDRFRDADYSKVDTKAMLQHWTSGFAKGVNPPSAKDEAALYSAIGNWVRQIERRGGTVIFVRMISSYSVLELEERNLPNVRYWRRFLEQAHVRGIHFSEIPGIEALRCPEGSHLSGDGARLFSRALGRELVARGWLTRTR